MAVGCSRLGLPGCDAIYSNFGGTCHVHLQSEVPEDRDRKALRNFGILQQHFMASQSRSPNK